MGWRRGVAVLALGLAVTGCSGDPGEGAVRESAPPVIVPGGPGEPARTLSGAPSSGVRPSAAPSEADRAYVQMMIAHHQQAVEMTALAPERAADAQVRGLAARIGAAQGPEITAMRGWLERNGLGSGSGGHDHAAMPGMATPEQMAALRAATGGEFDRQFLRLMIAHHEGAVSMATDLLTKGVDVFAQEMAQDVIATQTAEIKRMRAMLGG
ncbi:DUF305 domain-containing protein [Streptoalloteichus hindustanus]|uniref:Uncharacterized conserved protein, DUF305 family n=1 Tax=Streptoalloteichus hindustanus TaxID=2017 RepID=A0A1M5Q8Q3_STRHI|nr:DUF305 domain-containing protein [Streptoalloteichus hindustanus]SHH10475.1 Uncharacterized conserved protein, DUF305 family [Streptoalloteichus hindustanus]